MSGNSESELKGHQYTPSPLDYNALLNARLIPSTSLDAFSGIARTIMKGRRPQQSWTITAIPDSGASHILIRESDAHILQNVQYSTPNQVPFAVLKAANNAELTAIGRGTMPLAGLYPTAYIFRQNDLATNLLGLAPFCDLGCQAIFSKNKFQLCAPNQKMPFLTGSRQSGKSLLWQVNLSTKPTSDHIPPPYPHNGQGVYVEANSASQQDNASYVRFVHAALGYPAPTTFLKAVTNGYITRPSQFPRLTPKMARKYMPNAIASARGHLDKTQPNHRTTNQRR